MRRKNFQSNSSKLIFLFDVVVIVLSLAIAVGVRSQMSDYLFALSTAIAVFSLTLFLRMLILFLFDAYAISFVTFSNADMLRLLRINLVPSGLLLLFRLLSPVVSLRMPLSMIVIEYVTTTLGFILVRLLVHNRLVRATFEAGHKRRILLWSEIADLAKEIPDIEGFCREQRVEIMGILNSNPVFWQTEHHKYRIHGDESALRALVAGDDRISTLCFVRPKEVSKARAERVFALLKTLNMDLGVIERSSLRIIGETEMSQLVANRPWDDKEGAKESLDQAIRE